MSPEVRKNKKVAEELIHSILSPLGFKKQKLNWRRRFPEILQQFSLFHAPIGDHYTPDWGLNVLSLCSDLEPASWKLLLRWSYVDCVKDQPERTVYYTAFDLASDISVEERKSNIEKLFKYVLPCFEIFTTEAAVKEMSQSWHHPLRTPGLGSLPDSWLPADWYRDPLLQPLPGFPKKSRKK